MNRLLIFFFLNAFALQAQKDSVRLVDIQSSECKAMIEVIPGFLRKETIGDTTYINLFCSNNCAGYNSPEVTLSGDSVNIQIHYGTKTIRYLLKNGQYIDEDELNTHPKDSVLEEQTETIAACDCCYTFELKILGLDSSKVYSYFYNNQFVDPNYKTTDVIGIYEFPYFFRQPKSVVSQKFERIISKDKDLLEILHNSHLFVFLKVDTLDGSIKDIEIDPPYGASKNQDFTNQKLKVYFKSLSPINCIRTPSKKRFVKVYMISIGFDKGTKKLEINYEAGERITN